MAPGQPDYSQVASTVSCSGSHLSAQPVLCPLPGATCEGQAGRVGSGKLRSEPVRGSAVAPRGLCWVFHCMPLGILLAASTFLSHSPYPGPHPSSRDPLGAALCGPFACPGGIAPTLCLTPCRHLCCSQLTPRRWQVGPNLRLEPWSLGRRQQVKQPL